MRNRELEEEADFWSNASLTMCRLFFAAIFVGGHVGMVLAIHAAVTG